MEFKRIAKTAAMAVVAGSLLFSVSKAATPKKINATNVNFRDAATLSGNVIGMFQSGDTVNVQSTEGEWSKVEFGGKVGYVSSQYVGTQSVTKSKYGIGLLKVGSRGASVSAVQARLKELKYFNSDVTGYYGHITKDAVVKFQTKNGIKADGVVGSEVREKLGSASAVKAVEDKLKIEKTPWSQMNGIIPRGANFTLVDVATGKRFNVKRRGGSSHIDTEPLTSKDTAVMKDVYGSWSWSRRAVIVIYNGKAYAASMNGMPHGGESIGGSNGFNGHFCVHFYKSKTHGGNRVDPAHQAAVEKSFSQGTVKKNS